MGTKTFAAPLNLYNLKEHVDPHKTLFLNSIEDFKIEIFRALQEDHGLILPEQGEYYGKIIPYTKTSDEKIKILYEFWILINPHTYALEFQINEAGQISLVLNADGRTKSAEGPIWCTEHFFKIKDGKEYDRFINKVFGWQSAEEIYKILDLVAEYVNVEYQR